MGLAESQQDPIIFKKMLKPVFRFFVYSFIFLFVLTSCLSYYQKNQEFQTNFENGRFKEAQKSLDVLKDKKLRKTLILQKLNQGVVSFYLNEFEKSNKYFEEAYILGEDYQQNLANEVGSFLLNPNFVVYKPESHELMMIHYFKAINYLKLGNNEAALVEARRMNIKLMQLSSKFTSAKKLTEDAFAHALMGIVYQANGDFNNAFIAYRNAYNVYQNEYAKFFNITAPAQLKQDLINAAYRTGFKEEVIFYEKEFGLKFKPTDMNDKGEAVLFWNNGLCPVKDQSSIDFIMQKGQNGYYNFVNLNLGLSFAFYISDSDYQSNGFGDIHVYRIAFPKYVERPSVYNSATLKVNGETHKLELLQDVNKIAFKSLDDRMLTELGKSLLRFASKKALEAQIRKQNQTVGALAGIFNAVSETADTRNWQTLPQSISYARVVLPVGNHQVQMQTESTSGAKSSNLTFAIQKGKTSFYTFNSF